MRTYPGRLMKDFGWWALVAPVPGYGAFKYHYDGTGTHSNTTFGYRTDIEMVEWLSVY